VTGKVWAAFPYSKTPQREKAVYFSDGISHSVTKWFYYERPGENKAYKYTELADLKPYRLGGVKGYFYEQKFKKAGLEVDYSSKEINTIEKLVLGRIDLVPINELVARRLIKTHFPEKAKNFKTLDKPYSVKTLRLIVSRNYPESRAILKKFNKALKNCRARGGCKDFIEID
jgi:polar amino acid transport system substrate-binding protein